ncbi:putative mitochondrial hypothetical protein [Leptomonas pyrrhocoris]|uniref:CHCH domain-containing protein n=1 Tax=Leptomonas pyrrhocoris TaxID=157538 RepID=A0A0N0DS85_LEPPY|nr:putative mitochondrial hypothetical protein [Leptomonas pyrrhocoris]KPA75548.1 putative mitochondrial hypothetical protein [Leptomonas pyrrhocoris]|eukprot:XP_015653987.1 putative mitochondrial hypothetical protein [Leptomonas pyrrhocoris]
MGRSRSSSRGSGGFRRSSPHTAAPPPPPRRSEVTNVYVQRPMYGGGGGSGMMGTMAAVAGGSVLGHGISNYLYGHNNQAPTQPAEAQQLAQAAAQENNVCTPQLVGYSKCMEANPESADSCKWAWDYFLQCQRDQTQQQ